MSEPQAPKPSTVSSETVSSANLEPASVEGGLTSEPDSISELFARDPLTWDEAAMAKMIEHYRARRKEFDLKEATPKKTKAEPKIPKEDLKGLSGKGLLDLLEKKGLGLKKVGE